MSQRNLFVRKLNLKVLHYKPVSTATGTAVLTQLSLAECRELRELLRTESDEITSSPFPLIEAMEALDSLQQVSETDNPVQDPLLPRLKDLKAKSTTFPAPSVNKNTSLFLKMVSSEIALLKKKPNKVPSNSSPRHAIAFKNLQSYSHLTIKPANKGGCIVVMDNAHYKQMCLDILNNNVWYKPISFKQADHFMVEFYHLFDEAFYAGIIDKNNSELMRTSSPRLSTFYCLPKVHKPGPVLKGIPIVSGSGNLTEGASRFIDRVLKPHVESLFSYVKDTMSFLRFMDGLTAPVDSFLVTIDVECLYNSIPHDSGLRVISTFLDQMHPSHH